VDGRIIKALRSASRVVGFTGAGSSGIVLPQLVSETWPPDKRLDGS
jgi:hypothetical protein